MKRLLLMALISAVTARSAVPATVDGIQVADTVQLGSTTLVLNGAGRRTRLFFNLYIAALYLPSHASDAAKVLAEAGPKRVSLTMLRHLSADQLIAALREGIGHNSTPAEVAQMKEQIDALVATMAATNGANQGDVLTIDFLPDGTTRVGHNGRASGKPIPGRNFQRALLKVWLGPNPVQVDLKKTLLGG